MPSINIGTNLTKNINDNFSNINENLDTIRNTINSTPAFTPDEADDLSKALESIKSNIADINTSLPTMIPKAEELQAIQNLPAIQDAIDMPLGLTVGSVALGGVILSIILLLILIFTLIRLFNASNTIDDLKTDLQNQTNKVQDMSNRMSQLENTIRSLKSDGENHWRMVEQKFSDMQTISRFPQQPPQNIVQASPPQAAPYNPPPPPPPPKYLEFVDAFNKLSQQLSGTRSLETKNFIVEFMRRYKIQEFSCTNFEARVSEPVPPPQFNLLKNGDFWAYEYEPGIFAVVPSINVKNYNYNYHSQRAMGEVFDSNFMAGKTYGKIFVDNPAIFKGMWNLSKKGNLELS